MTIDELRMTNDERRMTNDEFWKSLCSVNLIHRFRRLNGLI